MRLVAWEGVGGHSAGYSVGHSCVDGFRFYRSFFVASLPGHTGGTCFHRWKVTRSFRPATTVRYARQTPVAFPDGTGRPCENHTAQNIANTRLFRKKKFLFAWSCRSLLPWHVLSIAAPNPRSSSFESSTQWNHFFSRRIIQRRKIHK